MRAFLFRVAVWLALCTSSFANVPCTVPFNLQNGTISDASQVMANYNALITCLTNAAAAGANADITSLTGLTTPLSYTLGGSSVYIGGTSTGTANAQVVASTTPIGFSLAQGNQVVFKVGFTNTGATTLNVNAQGATNVFRVGHSGPEALTGGELVVGNTAVAYFDGTQFILQGTFGDFGPSTTIASATTTDLGAGAPYHNSVISGTTTITSFGSSATVTEPVYLIAFNGVLTLTYNATSLILPGAADIVTAPNDTAVVQYLGSGNWYVTSYNRATGTAVVNPTPNCGFNKLVFRNNAGTPSTNVDVTAGSAVMVNATGNVPIFRTSVSFTVNLTTGTVTSAANGMDGEARPTSGWVYLYMIDNGTAAAGLGSTSSTAPTKPAGYNFICYMGAMRADGSTNLLRSVQKGNTAQYTVTAATNTAAYPTIASGATGTINGTTFTGTASAVTALVPVNATALKFSLATPNASTQTAAVAPNNNFAGFNSATNPVPWWQQGTGSGTGVGLVGEFVLESSNVFYAASGAAGLLQAIGWRDAVNAN